jgi:hypothetical protein
MYGYRADDEMPAISGYRECYDRWVTGTGVCSAVADTKDIARTVMFRIVGDECLPIPTRFSGPLVASLKECFSEGSGDAAEHGETV